MKSKNIVLVLTLAVLVFAGDMATAQKPKKISYMDKSPLDMVYYPLRGAKKVKVIYSRPFKKDREVFGGMVKYGEVWRTGANETTEIRFAQDVTFGGKKVKAGTYALFTIPGKKKWTVIINTGYENWGHYSYKKEQDVVRVKIAAKNDAEESLENFSMAIKESENGATLIMGWDKTRVKVPITF